MTERKLRAVHADEVAERKPPMSVLEAAENGTRIDELRAMRVVIARSLDNPDTSARDLAALSRRQIEISRDIEALASKELEDASSARAVDIAFDATAI